ncbi:MAG: nuclear transport factor 2 family protein [Bdellovibrionota bacterium]
MGDIMYEITPSFQKTLVAFLEAVRLRNWDVFLTYLSTGAEITAVLPDGKVHVGYENFLATQKPYFQSRTGLFTYKIRQSVVGSEVAFAAADVTYEDEREDGQKFRWKLYIGFVFKKSGQSWYLIHIQDSILEKQSL